MEIVFIGAGNLATQLSQAFQRVGHNVIQVFSRTQENASALGTRLGCEWTTSLEEIRKDAHLYVISVSDSAFQQVAEKLHATLQSAPAKDDSILRRFAEMSAPYGVKMEIHGNKATVILD